MKRSIIIATLFSVVCIFFWNTSWLLPLKLLVVLMHETGHAMAAIATGGSVESITINQLQGGLASYRGGYQFLVANAGYIGSSIFGAIILLTASRKLLQNHVALAFGLLVLLETVLWVRGWFAFGFALAASVVCIILGLQKFSWLNWLKQTFMQIIGTMCCLYAVYDIFSDTLSFGKVVGHKSDAQLIAEITYIPAVIWGCIWITIAVAVFIITLWMIARSEKYR